MREVASRPHEEEYRGMKVEHIIEINKAAVGVSKATHFVIVPLWAYYLGYGIKEIGLIITVRALAYGIFIPLVTYIFGVLSDKKSVKIPLVGAHMVEAISYILIMTGDYPLLVLGSAIGGIAEHLMYPSVVKALGRDQIRKSKTEIFVKSYLVEYISEGLIVFAFSMLYMIEHAGDVYIQIMSFVTVLCFAVGIISSKLEAPEIRTTRDLKLRKYENAILKGFVFYNAGVALGVGMTIPYVPYLLRSHFSLEPQYVAWTYVTLYALHALIVGLLLKYAKKKGVLATIIGLETITASLLILMGLFFPRLEFFIFLYILRSSIYIFITPLSASYKSRVFRHEIHAVVSSTIRSVWTLANGVGRALGIIALAMNPQMTFIGAGILGLLGIIGFVIFLLEVPGLLHTRHY